MTSSLKKLTCTTAVTVVIAFVRVFFELFIACILFFPLLIYSIYNQVSFVEYGVGDGSEPAYVYPNAYLDDPIPDEECEQEDAQQRELALALLSEAAAEEKGQTDENTPPTPFKLSPRRILSLYHHNSTAPAPPTITAATVEDDKNAQLRVVILNVPAGIHLFHRNTELELDIYPFRSASPLRTAIQTEASRRSFPFRKSRKALLQEVINNIAVYGLKYESPKSMIGEDGVGTDGAGDGNKDSEDLKEMLKVWDVEETWRKIMAEDVSKGAKKRVEVYLVGRPSVKSEEAHGGTTTTGAADTAGKDKKETA